MKIKIYNENRLTRQPFFQDLIEFLSENDDVTLRQIHKKFDGMKNLDRQLDSFIAADLIWREDKRYGNNFPIFDDEILSDVTENQPTKNEFDDVFFVKFDSKLREILDTSKIYQSLSNETNVVKLHFTSRFDRQTDTLANYFYKVANNYPLSALETEIYQMIGDCDIEYALKYMTTFLLKFTRKEIVKNKADIFVKVLEKYGYVRQISEKEYESLIEFDEIEIPAVKFDRAENFIKAQIAQQIDVKNFISLEI